MNTGVIFGGPSYEHDVSVLTGLQALRASDEVTFAIYWSPDGDFYYLTEKNLEATEFSTYSPKSGKKLDLFLNSEPGFYIATKFSKKRIDTEVLINCCHGGPGEDGFLQSLLEICNISYTGPGVRAAQIGMDKLLTALFVKDLNIPVLPRIYLTPYAEVNFHGPYIIKPRFGGSSIGIEVCSDIESAKSIASRSKYLRDCAIIEPFRPELFDLQIAVLTYPDITLSAIEKPLRKVDSGHILDFSDKYVADEGMAGASRELPAQLPNALEQKLREYAVKLAKKMALTGCSRLDFLTNGEDEIYFNEINTIPGSLARYLFIDPKLEFKDLISRLVAEAKNRSPNYSMGLQLKSGLLMKSASIAQKLAGS